MGNPFATAAAKHWALVSGLKNWDLGLTKHNASEWFQCAPKAWHARQWRFLPPFMVIGAQGAPLVANMVGLAIEGYAHCYWFTRIISAGYWFVTVTSTGYYQTMGAGYAAIGATGASEGCGIDYTIIPGIIGCTTGYATPN